MAVVESVGYGGTVDYPDYGRGVVSGSRYTLDRGNPLRPTRVTSGADRSVRLAPGTAQGYGIRDTCTETNIQLEPVSSGVRWDEIVLRRDWSAEESSFAVIQGGSNRALPVREQEPGILDDQPIALVQITAGQQYPTDLVDLRCWAGDGGLVAVDSLALAYLDDPGTRVSIGDTTYTRVVSPSGATSWDVKGPPRDTGWISSPYPGSTWNATRRYRVIDGIVWVQVTGNRAASSFTDGAFDVMTFNTAAYRPTQTAYGTCWVGRNSYRAYCTTAGQLRVEPMTINQGNTFQITIQWPIG